MMRTLEHFAAICGGQLQGANLPFATVSTDTRSLQQGDLYLALRGPNFDGNDFLQAAASAGAVAAVVDRPVAQAAIPVITVADGQQALTAAAQAWRKEFQGKLIGVAGSNGKTTVKEMIAAILAQLGPSLATRGNFNNHIGVPLTLLRLETAHRSAVIEIGANRPGEVAALVEIARPDVGLITNAGAEHLEGFGDLDGVARAEGEMVAGLTPGDAAVINADDPYVTMWRGMTRARVVTFGFEAAADFRATDLQEAVTDAGFNTTFNLQSPLGAQAVRLNVGGQHNVRNALAAAAATAQIGATLPQIAAGLAAMRPVAGRLQPSRTRGGARLIDDSYNANPSSMRAGIDVLVQLAGEPWLVMGDMGELGDHAQASHIEIGEYARQRGVRRLFATGALSTYAVEAFGAGASWHADTNAMAAAVEASLRPDVNILVKGSRSNRLERVVAALAGTAVKENH